MLWKIVRMPTMIERACESCGVAICPLCDEHDSDCECPLPDQHGRYAYQVNVLGHLIARPWLPWELL
jgi:hypothetical protein